MFDRLRRLLPGIETDEQASEDSALEVSDEALRDRWTIERVSDRDVEVFVPDGDGPLTGVVLYLHGHGGVGLRTSAAYTRLLHEHRLAAAGPDGGRSWWLDFHSPEFPEGVTPQQWLRSELIPWIEDQFALSPPQIALLGVSMGGQGVLQLAYRHARQFPVVAAVSPAVDFHQLWGTGIPLDRMFPDAESARQATVVLNLHPLNWPRYQFICCDPQDTDWFDGAARLGMKLSSSGIPHERDLDTSSGGHSWDYFDHMAPRVVDHLVQGLRRCAPDE